MKKILPPTYFFVCLISSIVLDFLFPIKNIIPKPFNYLGIIFIIFGSVINIITDNMFKDKKTTVKPHETPSAFIDHGLFKISRHPMYLGMFSILLGTSTLLMSISSFLSPILFVIAMEKIFIPIEEKNMKKKFGKKYIDYKKRVRKWI